MLTCFLLLSITSCKKTELDSAKSPNTLNAITAQEVNINTATNQCLVTHTEDDLYGYTLDIFYNRAGNPDSMSFYGSFPVTMQYDSKGRLIRTNFGGGTNGFRFEYLYKNNSVLPAAINYYYGGTSLQVIFKLTYDSKGQIIKFGTISLSNPQYNAVESYEYNDMGNVTKVTYTSQNGTTSYIENEVSKYDNKPNFMGGNKWLKFILYNSGVDIFYYFRMFSKNNSLEWNIDFGDGFKYLFSADYEYNSYGFANKSNIHSDFGDFTELSSSTCDAPTLKSQSLPLTLRKKSGMSFKNLRNMPSTVPVR